MEVVEISSSNLMFGCLVGTLLNGKQCMIELFQRHGQRIYGTLPQKGDIVLCKHVHYSVFRPTYVIHPSNILEQMILSRFLPLDVTLHYFCQRWPICVA